MEEIITEVCGRMLRVELNRPTKKNAMTSSMYATLADVFNEAAKDERIRVVLWHGAGDSFCAGNDVEDFSGESSRTRRLLASESDESAPRFRRAADRGRTWCRHWRRDYC
jgi:enoyl-CoA hydratase/carnithine racemase